MRSRAAARLFLGLVLPLLVVAGCKDEVTDPGTPDGADAVEAAGGTNQVGDVGAVLPVPLSVRVVDEDDDPVPGVIVVWSATGGILSASLDTTDASGLSSVSWAMPNSPGAYTATALVSGVGQVSFSAQADPVLADLVFRYVDAGGFHACGLTTTDQFVCWGYNADGQLGGEAGPPEFFPTLQAGNARYRMVSNGWYHGCGIDFALEVFCWGENRDMRAKFPFVASFQDLDAGLTHTCGVTIARGLACWGYNLQGQLGVGTNEEVPDSTEVILVEAASATAGGLHSCGILLDGTALCWGFNSDGQIGNGFAGADVLTPALVTGGLSFQTESVTTPQAPDPDMPLPNGPYISAGYLHTCGIDTDGDAHCWGLNEAGQLGNGSTTSTNVPVAVTGGHQFARISAGLAHTCALTAAGAIWCWGDNTWGQLGDGGGADQSSPVQVTAPGGATFAWVSAGENHTCAVTTTGVAWCWGDNHYGQLGTGDAISSAVPVKVALQP